MLRQDICVTKRDGSCEAFSAEKIARAIGRALAAAGTPDEEAARSMAASVAARDGMGVEEIQNRAEEALMAAGRYAAARAFILYRQRHKEDRETAARLRFLTNYCEAENPATGSKYDANANVEHKNIATLIGELPKQGFIRLNRRLLCDRIRSMYGRGTAERYLDLLNRHFLYKNDETSLANYCASITMYPWLLDGTRSIGGNSAAPTNLKSFCGGFVNMVFIDKVVTDCFEQIVYSINQPTGARNFQAVFWNISYYDRYYFEALFDEFRFPDGSRPSWPALDWLQRRFMRWFNAERTKTVLTFPVETMALLTENGDAKDSDYADLTAGMYAAGHSFFTYMSDRADSLSSCCRLRNEIQDNGFSYTLGAGGVSTGSKSVLTLNLNRIVQEAGRRGRPYLEALADVADLAHKVQLAYNENLRQMQARGMLPLFDAGYINLSRQYLTIGVNGLVEAAESLGIEISDNPAYEAFAAGVLGVIEKLNKQYRTKDVMFNCEMIPAENVGVKHARWDREDGYHVPRDCYNSYFYVVEDNRTDVIEKFRLHGRRYTAHLTGGSALHMNLDEHLTQAQYRQLLRVAAREGCNYFTFNIPNTLCNECGHIDKRYLKACPVCGSGDVDYLTRVIGYLKRVSNFSLDRQKEAARRHYAHVGQTVEGTC